ncbi:MAG: FecR family protein [Tannerellaceae bacterium]|jgi:ferric-dicitrate binding protein FerR (iron transport regulator)|nr:FecR family protein [Tannerellaceae bacterium]
MDKVLLKKYIEGETITPAEKAQIVAWVKADSSNRADLMALHKLRDMAIWHQPSICTKSARQARKTKSLLIGKAASVAAIILLLAGSSLYLTRLKRKIPEALMQTIHVPPGQRVELLLADSTRVWINAGSTFTFPTIFSLDSREVVLDGEAYFDVKKNEKQPFIVRTSSYHIAALGTEFNVLSYKQSPLFEVSLFNGSVDVYSDKENHKIRLEPNTKVYLSNNHFIKEQISNYNQYLWKEGLLCFEDEQVDGMISKLELYYDVKILVKNNSFRTQRYTGKFRTKDGIEHILRVFQLRDKFSYEKDDDENIITIK